MLCQLWSSNQMQDAIVHQFFWKPTITTICDLHAITLHGPRHYSLMFVAQQLNANSLYCACSIISGRHHQSAVVQLSITIALKWLNPPAKHWAGALGSTQVQMAFPKTCLFILGCRAIISNLNLAEELKNLKLKSFFLMLLTKFPTPIAHPADWSVADRYQHCFDL